MYEDMEKGVLKPLPKDRYEISEWKKAKVNIDYHIELKGHYYSVPYQLINEEIEIRYTARVVEIYQGGRRITSHPRSDRQGQHTTIREHMPRSHQAYMEWTPSRIIEWAGKIGESVKTVVETIINSRAIHEHGYRPSLGIIRLGKRYGEARLESACKRAIAIKGYSYHSIKSILEKGLDKHPLPAEVTGKRIIHENIRGKEYYANINNN